MTHSIANDYLTLTLDERGSLLSLRNRRSGQEYIACGGLDLWQIIYPHDEDPETPVYGSGQAPAQVQNKGTSLHVRHQSLVDHRGRRLEMEFAYDIVLEGEQIVMTAGLQNHSEVIINELWFPMIGGLGALGSDPACSFLLYPESAGRRFSNPIATLADRNAQPVRGARFHCVREFYPGKASMQWMGLYGDAGSLYVGSHDRTLQTTTVGAHLNLAANPAQDSLTLEFIKYPFCRPGQSWNSEPFVLAVHKESWHTDARRYRRFADTYQDHRRPRAEWVMDMPAMHDIVMLHQHGRVNFRYQQIPQICEAAAAAGIDVIKLTGWSHGGHDNMLPDFEPSDRLGGQAVLEEQLATARQRGFRSVLYFHFIQMSPNSKFYARHGEFCQLKGYYGHPFVDVFTWPSHGTIIGMNERFRLINACVASEPWQQHVLDCVRRGLALGSDCVFLDQTAGAPSSFMCFDSRHNHPSPALACGPGKTRLASAARELLKRLNPQAALGAEYICDVILQYFDFTIPFGMGFFAGGQNFGAMYRFTFPEDVLLTQYIAREDFEQLAFSFVMGYRFFLAPRQQCDLLNSLKPEFVQRLAALIRLQRKYGAVLLRGQYLDTLPLQNVPPDCYARAYESPAGALATVWNPTATPQRLEICWSGRLLKSIETPAQTLDLAAPFLAAGEVAVMLFE